MLQIKGKKTLNLIWSCIEFFIYFIFIGDSLTQYLQMGRYYFKWFTGFYRTVTLVSITMSDIPSDHGKEIVAREEWAAGDVGNGLFPCVNKIGVDFPW